MPPKIATPRIARGMSLDGLCASSPSVADASKPAKDRKPNTTPRNSADTDVPGARLNTDQVNVDPPGAEWLSSLTNTTTVTTRIRVTVQASTTSSVFVPPLAGTMASTKASSRAAATKISGAQAGGLLQAPIDCSSPVPKIP